MVQPGVGVGVVPVAGVLAHRRLILGSTLEVDVLNLCGEQAETKSKHEEDMTGSAPVHAQPSLTKPS